VANYPVYPSLFVPNAEVNLNTQGQPVAADQPAQIFRPYISFVTGEVREPPLVLFSESTFMVRAIVKTTHAISNRRILGTGGAFTSVTFGDTRVYYVVDSWPWLDPLDQIRLYYIIISLDVT